MVWLGNFVEKFRFKDLLTRETLFPLLVIALVLYFLYEQYKNKRADAINKDPRVKSKLDKQRREYYQNKRNFNSTNQSPALASTGSNGGDNSQEKGQRSGTGSSDSKSLGTSGNPEGNTTAKSKLKQRIPYKINNIRGFGDMNKSGKSCGIDPLFGGGG